jgi:methylated-DNA-protein-cysteine methyltransferase-like protein
MFEKIRKTIQKIPKGKVATYGEVAKVAGFAGAARQVVWALQGASGLGLPWHRVVGAGGKIRLPRDAGMEQRMRLEMEGVEFSGAKIDMKRFGWVPRKVRKGAKGAKTTKGRQ